MSIKGFLNSLSKGMRVEILLYNEQHTFVGNIVDIDDDYVVIETTIYANSFPLGKHAEDNHEYKEDSSAENKKMYTLTTTVRCSDIKLFSTIEEYSSNDGVC